MSKLLHWLAVLGSGYLALLILTWLLQGCMIHFPSRALKATPADAGLGYEELDLTTSDGERLHAWFVPAREARGVLLFFHGNAGNISHRLESLRIFHELGLEVLILDYRGYGRSSGRPSEKGLYRDAEAAYDYLIEERKVPPEQLLVFGRSLGAAVGAHLASQRPVGGLILESGFTSVPDLGAELYPFLPVRLLARYRYDTREALSAVTAPVLVVHSRDDDIIPFSHGRALFEAAAEPRQFLELEGDHNTGFLRSRERYVRGLEQFLRTLER
ncbi:alpha/beta hydrolase [Marinimicrobium sp. C6131]|uniref:alpha/beta hydrolase n=1 Tax=Marinimicrobium sp. C6131 TaxID=3022676 RepID=UPI00223DE753|nr:alpha/beta hydrolase [Marinimicrobium sp. C6131]UZJ44449.1 alpha/beta hydrolase [Marinimicrobium sp. C6131]